METDEMKAEIAEAANDMGYIARRAQIAASNLRSVADALQPVLSDNPFDRRKRLLELEGQCLNLVGAASAMKMHVGMVLAEFGKGETETEGETK